MYGIKLLYRIIILLSCSNAIAQNTFKDIEVKLDTQCNIFPQEKLHLHLDKSIYIPGDTIWFKAYLVDAAYHLPTSNSRYVYTELINQEDSIISRVMIRPDSLNILHGYLPVATNMISGDYNIRAYTAYMENYKDYFFQKKIHILSPQKGVKVNENPDIVSDIDIQFFPEGGQSPVGTNHKIAFKAIGTDGLHRNIKGVIIDEKQDTITPFASTHLGMGYFMLQYSPGKQYYADCINEQGKKKRIKLPEPENGVSLKVQHSRNRIAISISRPASPVFSEDSLFALIHTRGILQYWDKWKADQEFLYLNTESFPSGISQIALFDSNKNLLSERLIFVLNENQADVSVNPDKEVYGKRKPVNLKFILKDIQATDGDCSVSVTDDNDLNTDTTFTITSNLLLTSELKGYIENPGYYMQTNNRQAANAADLLMLTQGWRRYDIAGIMKNKHLAPVIAYETSMQIQGNIKDGYYKKGATVNGQVTLYVPDYDYSDAAISDDNGAYSISNFEFPDSTLYLLQGSTGRGSSENVILDVRERSFPPVNTFYKSGTDEFIKNEESIGYQMKAMQKYMDQNDIRTIDLPNIDIQAAPISKPANTRSLYEQFNTHQLNEDEILDKTPVLTDELLLYLPGMFGFRKYFQSLNKGGTLVDSGENAPCLVVLNDHVMPSDFDINMIPVSSIKSIGVISGPKMVLFGRDGAPVINREEAKITPKKALVITTKETYTPSSTIKKNSSFVNKTFFGFQKAAEFYSPRYEAIDSIIRKDLRTTIYWNPSVKLSTDKESDISFYTSDNTTSYSIIVEGITNNGDIIYSKHKIRVK